MKQPSEVIEGLRREAREAVVREMGDAVLFSRAKTERASVEADIADLKRRLDGLTDAEAELLTTVEAGRLALIDLRSERSKLRILPSDGHAEIEAHNARQSAITSQVQVIERERAEQRAGALVKRNSRLDIEYDIHNLEALAEALGNVEKPVLDALRVVAEAAFNLR